jgi:hypothetical protein
MSFLGEVGEFIGGPHDGDLFPLQDVPPVEIRTVPPWRVGSLVPRPAAYYGVYRVVPPDPGEVGLRYAWEGYVYPPLPWETA